MHLVVHPGYLLVVPIGTGVTRLSPLRPEFTKLDIYRFTQGTSISSHTQIARPRTSVSTRMIYFSRITWFHIYAL